MTFIKYAKAFYCGFCGMKIKRGREQPDKNGGPRCWKCGHPLRGNVRNKNEGKNR